MDDAKLRDVLPCLQNENNPSAKKSIRCLMTLRWHFMFLPFLILHGFTNPANAQDHLEESASYTYSIHPGLPPFTFTRATDDSEGIPEGALVVTSKHSIIQVIDDSESDFPLVFEREERLAWFDVQDVDFDGYGDITSAYGCGAYGNCGFTCYRYDPEAGLFILASILSQQGVPYIDTTNQQLVFEYRRSAVGGGTWDVMKYVDGKPILVSEEILERDRQREVEREYQTVEGVTTLVKEVERLYSGTAVESYEEPYVRFTRDYQAVNGEAVLVREIEEQFNYKFTENSFGQIEDATLISTEKITRELVQGKMEVIRREFITPN